MDLRCDSGRLFGIIDGNLIEVACRSQRCGYRPGIVVLHRFSIATGKLVNTRLYKNPRKVDSE